MNSSNVNPGDQIKASQYNDLRADAININYRDFVFGENINAGDVLYLNKSDGKVYKASATSREQLIGVADESGTTGQTKKVKLNGFVDKNFVFEETIGETIDYNRSGTSAGTYQLVDDGIYRIVFRTGDFVGNMTKIRLFLSKGNDLDFALYINIYKINEKLEIIGSSLGGTTITNPDVGSTETEVIKPLNINNLEPRTYYMIHMEILGSSSSKLYIHYINDTSAPREIIDADLSLTKFFKISTYYTKKVYGKIGDNVYLQDTAGQVGLQEGTNSIKVGKVISSSCYMIDFKYDDNFISNIDFGFYGFSKKIVKSFIFVIPRNTKKVIFNMYRENIPPESERIHSMSIGTFILDKTGLNIVKYTGYDFYDYPASTEYYSNILTLSFLGKTELKVETSGDLGCAAYCLSFFS